MSLENHPNFHAVQFAADIVSSYYKSLRGCATPEISPDLHQEIVDFVATVEEKVDAYVMPKVKK